MLLAVAGFELRQQLRGHVFWVVFAISMLMVLGSVSVDELRVGLPNEGLRNGAMAIVLTHLVWTLFFLFTSAAFVADAVLRDELTRFAPIIRAAPVGRGAYLFGRFGGAFAAVVLCFVSVPIGMVVGSLMPWVDPATVGPVLPDAYLFAFFVIAIPNLLLGSALGFALATLTRSMTGALIGAVVLLIAIGLGSAELSPLSRLLEPFGTQTISTFYSGAVTLDPPDVVDARTSTLDVFLLGNRLFSLGVSASAIVLTYFGFGRLRRHSRSGIPAAGPPALGTRTQRLVLAQPRHGLRVTLAQLGARVRLEFGQLVLTPAFAVLLILGVTNAAVALWRATDPYGWPDGHVFLADQLIPELFDNFRLVPIVVALFFAGELMWNERERRMHELVGASPLPDALFVLPKLLALAAVLGALALVAALAGAGVQVARDAPVDAAGWLLRFVLPATFDWVLVAVLALFLQAVAPTKLAGWGLMVLYLIGSLALQRLGFDDPIYRYGRYPGWPLPASLSDAPRVGLYQLYWGAFAVMLAALAVVLVGRGVLGGWRRLRVRRPEVQVASGAALVFVVVGVMLGRE